MNPTDPIARWHDIVRAKDPDLLDDWLDEHAVFRSPAVHTPQEGRAVTKTYLAAALVVLGPGLVYHHEWRRGGSAVLEFTTTIDGIDVHGVDMIEWNDELQVTGFTVMVRPVKGLHALMERMGAELMREAS
ncbi:nuclear transport factor 2 family protein [Aeromicrobium fastidiosum]|uniref:Nuclear transport factor 2 family protein n=1 Tax=Aeromicrobium fastidiosum TaxID=52699 RepID=A0A641APM6_9ACTN|nr:nuclear transport factor 2 family protein [Aeromicrobium fastidiosum]KAA1380040.1 nuclear transport factor 2 family protein [Aeromicrobium fastidiosum]MBP2389565.1 hypothetical protein [Aeromicrobium fastidiosum]